MRTTRRKRKPPRAVQYVGAWPRHLFHNHQPQRMAGHIDAIAQGIGTEQTGMRVIAENIDERAGVDRVNMLRVQRQPVARQPVGNPRIG